MDTPDVSRLESLWKGDFGDEYVDRNASAYEARGSFWNDRIADMAPASVLEVGCNLGGNLRWLEGQVPSTGLFGVDINEKALARLRTEAPSINAVWSAARHLPFRDAAFDLVFTMGVLIHQPEATLPIVMSEMVRCSSRWILVGEYHADETVAVPYRGHDGALFKRDYGRLFTELFPELALRGQGFLGRDQGWDDVTWWSFEIL